MKKLLLLLLFVAFGTFTFYSCDREDEIGENSLLKNSLNN